MSENIPDLTIDALDEESGLLLLQQDSGGNLDRIAIHPVHVRHIAERFGLVPAGNAAAHRAIRTLARRLRVLRDRINYLGEYLALHSDHQHADLSYEQAYAMATADIADEFCEGLPALAQSCENLTKPESAQGAANAGTLDPQAVLDLAETYFRQPAAQPVTQESA